jgi:hypothetical protein
MPDDGSGGDPDGGPGSSPDSGPSDDTTTGAPDDSSGNPPSVCGDGIIEGDEECDDGDANGAGKACLANCTHNVCGDGDVGPNEQCDDGRENGSGKACLADCVLNVCGDGDVGPGEACDDGEGNELAAEACAPDCSTVIETKIIRLSATINHGSFGNNKITFVDSKCDVGYKAMFAIPGVRVATSVANQSVGAVDWVLQPYTAYTRADGTLIWVTDDVPLLGVRNGASEPLENPIAVPCTGEFCSLIGTRYLITGLQQNWITPPPQNCNGWASSSTGVNTTLGDRLSATQFLSNNTTTDCEFTPPDCTIACAGATVYCVEQ